MFERSYANLRANQLTPRSWRANSALICCPICIIVRATGMRSGIRSLADSKQKEKWGNKKSVESNFVYQMKVVANLKKINDAIPHT